MDYSSLPPFPAPSKIAEPPTSRSLTLHQIRVLTDLAWLAGIVALLFWVHQLADGTEREREAARLRAAVPPPTRLDFYTIQQRFDRVSNRATREEVEWLLGEPTERTAWGPEIEQFEKQWKLVPADREWNRWIDPADPNRWVAIVYIGPPKDQTTFGKLKNGF